MNELVKSMLAVRPWFAPNDGPCLVGTPLTTPGDVFPVAFHISLLEVGSKSVHVLQEKVNRLRLGILHVVGFRQC